MRITNGTVRTNRIEMPYARISLQTGITEKTLVILPGLSVKPVVPSAALIGERYGVFMENGYAVYVLDRRTNAGKGYSVLDMAEDTACALQALGIQKAYVFGASQGGMIAACLGITHPELVSRLMLGSTTAMHRKSSDALFRRWIDLASERKEKELIDSIGSAVYAPSVWTAIRESAFSANACISEAEYKLFIRMAEALLSFDCRERLHEIVCPTFVIGARGDRVFSSAGSEEIMNILGCEGYIYDDSFGHGVYDEAPDYVERLFRFCNGDPLTASSYQN